MISTIVFFIGNLGNLYGSHSFAYLSKLPGSDIFVGFNKVSKGINGYHYTYIKLIPFFNVCSFLPVVGIELHFKESSP